MTREKRYQPLPPTDRTATAVLLLFLHLLQDGVLLDLDQIATLVLAQTEPKLFDPLTLLRRARAPDLAVILRALGGAGVGRWTRFVGDRCV